MRNDMLTIYSSTIEIAREAGIAARTIAQHDADLARQLRRAATSIPLNLAEGAGVSGGHRRQRYMTALGSAREVLACLETGHVMGYSEVVGTEARSRLDQVIGTLVRIVR